MAEARTPGSNFFSPVLRTCSRSNVPETLSSVADRGRSMTLILLSAGSSSSPFETLSLQ